MATTSDILDIHRLTPERLGVSYIHLLSLDSTGGFSVAEQYRTSSPIIVAPETRWRA